LARQGFNQLRFRNEAEFDGDLSEARTILFPELLSRGVCHDLAM
jgi:hypothetical protein